jgi:cell division protein FtsQ
MPMEMKDPDDEKSPRFGGRAGVMRFEEPSGPWWRPSSTMGRVFLGLGVAAVLSMATAGVVAAKGYLDRDARFRIGGAGDIQATGLTQVSRADMLQVFGEDIGRNIFFVPLEERRKQLENIPWVQHATVMRLLPDRIEVSIAERKPVAFVRQGQQVGLVDAEGVLLSMPAATMAQHHYSFPVVTGVDAHDSRAARSARMAVYERLLGDLDSTHQHLSEQISEIDLTDPQDARVSMPEQGRDILAHFGDDRFLDRYQRYKSHIAEWREQYPKLVAVDLRYDSQVVLEMTPGTNAVAAAVEGDGASTPSLVAAQPAGASSETPALGGLASAASGRGDSALKPSAGTPSTKSFTQQAAPKTSAEDLSPIKTPVVFAPDRSNTDKTSADKTSAAKTATSKVASNKTGPSKTPASQMAMNAPPVQPVVKPAIASQPVVPVHSASASLVKPAITRQTVSRQKNSSRKKAIAAREVRIEQMAGRQRASRERAAKAKAARAKKEQDKKPTASQHAATTASKPLSSLHGVSATTEGQ